MSLATDDAERKESYRVVVIGSGYGASAVAMRVAEAMTAHDPGDVSLCILERGREIVAGDFPKDLDALRKELQLDDVDGREGDPMGLFDFHLNPDVDVLVGCGLGGTSLINGGICITPEARVFDGWPGGLTLASLAHYYARAKAVLRPATYPGDPPLAKLTALKTAADAIGEPFSLVEVNVHYDRAIDAAPGVAAQKPCTLCGDCVTGCNFSAKNTLPMTYLPRAKAAGAHVFTQIEVEYVERRESGQFTVHGVRRPARGGDPVAVVVDADVVVVGAGALGSTGLLLRSQAPALRFSSALGSRFSTNGDAITIGYNGDAQTNVIGHGDTLPADGSKLADVGPTLVGMIDARGGRTLEDAVILEEGAFPSGMTKLLLPVVQLLAASAKETRHTVGSWLRERGREGRDLFGSAADGALNHSMLYLTMGHDGAAGRMTLDGHQHVRIAWPTLRDARCFTLADELTRKATTALGGMHLRDPLASNPFFKIHTTVHALGGCAMGDAAASGVVDHAGRVFDGARGAAAGAVHAGLYVADASIVPTSLGVNPLYTITALAERVADGIVEHLGLPNPVPDAPRVID